MALHVCQTLHPHDTSQFFSNLSLQTGLRALNDSCQLHCCTLLLMTLVVFMQSMGLLNENNSLYIHVTDSCPCLQFDGGSETVTGTNAPCCGNVNHFDLSFFGFQKLAHPLMAL